MSCSDVVRHQAQATCHPSQVKLPAASAVCSTSPCPFSSPAVTPSQQNKIVVYSKMQETLEVTLSNKQEEDDKDQPTEMEYLNSRCVLFTYFQGDIGSVVDEHFSRALNQANNFNSDALLSKTKTDLCRENTTIASQRRSFPASFWTSSYQTPPPPSLSGIHHDFPITIPSTFSVADPNSWPGHTLHQTALPAPSNMTESWHYPLASQMSSSYGHMHDVYMHHHHPHVHMHHHHHPTSHLDPRYKPLPMPSVCAGKIPPPQCDATKSDPTTVSCATSAWAGAFHGTVDIVPTFGSETEKARRRTQELLKQFCWDVFDHPPPYGPDLVPSDYY